MIFSSPHYIFIFLPIVFFGYFFLCKINKQYAALFLILSSLFFYSYWKLEFLPIIIFSILFNYYISVLIFKKSHSSKILQKYYALKHFCQKNYGDYDRINYYKVDIFFKGINKKTSFFDILKKIISTKNQFN